MDDLITWLRAQLDEDERVAREALSGPVGEPWHPIASRVTGSSYDAVGQRGFGHREPDADGLGTYVIADFGPLGGTRTVYLVRFQPRRMLAEVEAKRRILDLHAVEDDGGGGGPYCLNCHGDRGYSDRPMPCATVRLLALPYADRSGYREEWRP